MHIENLPIKLGTLLIFIGLLTVLISSCDVENRSGRDGYAFEVKEFERTILQMTIVVIPDQQEFNRLRKIHAPNVEGLQAFATFSKDQSTCTIYIKDPAWRYYPEWIGHETAHCIWGRWHPNRDAAESRQGLR